MTGTAMTTARRTAVAPLAPAPAVPAAPMDFADLYRMAEVLVTTKFLPEHIKEPGQACAIILAGRELGLPPMRALRSLQLVKGKVVESADSQLARFKSDGGRAVFVTLTETEAELHLRHPNGDEHTERFTLADATKAGLAGQGSMYTKYPKAMLRSRVITAGLKSLGWEGGAGVYDPEEAQAFGPPATQATQEHQYGDEMTLEQALATRLRGRPEKWGGNGGKPLSEVPEKVLRAALEFYEKKLREEHDDALAVHCEALTLVVAEYERREPAQPHASGAVPPGGRVEDALALGDARPARHRTSMDPELEG